jgi:hypothetical protein
MVLIACRQPTAANDPDSSSSSSPSEERMHLQKAAACTDHLCAKILNLELVTAKFANLDIVAKLCTSFIMD